MKQKVMLVVFSLLITGSAFIGYRTWSSPDKPSSLLARQCCDGSAMATCTGDKDCRACKNCKYCKHCAKNGGTCGVCK